MSLNIKNPDVVRLATQVSRLTGETKTELASRLCKGDDFASADLELA